jgi:hypothetical protein
MVRSTFFQRFGLDTLCEVSANLLSNDPTHDEDTTTLQVDARRDGKCSVRVILALSDGTYLAHIAASPDFKRALRFTVIFSETQLAQPQPYDGCVQAVSSWSAVSARLLIGSRGADE